MINIIFEFGIGLVIEVEFVVVCSVGLYGIVVVYWEVVNVFLLGDLILVKGNVFFNDGDMWMMFKVKVVLDFVLEKVEIFIIVFNIIGKIVY